jgi:hypothetical protein
MTTNRSTAEPDAATLAWLLDGDPAIRWRVLRDLVGAPDDAVAAERARIGVEGWGARLLALQGPDGHWGVGAYDGGAWTSTTDVLLLLRDLGLDPASEPARQAIDRVRERATWGPHFGDAPFFEGETEPCINGRVLAIGAYFGEASATLHARLLAEQLDDGGWNCEAGAPGGSVRSSFHTTICVLEGLLAVEEARGATKAERTARERGEAYLLERGLFRSRSTGAVVDPRWLEFSFPTRWCYDVLWGLDYLRRSGVAPDGRVAEALDLVERKRGPDGRWALERVHAGDVPFELEGGVGTPSRWITLRALQALRWGG